VRAIGIDVSERRGNHVCVLELARPAAGPPATRAGGAGQLADAAAANWQGGRLQATFHPPAEVTAVVAAVRALGPEVVVAIDAPSGPTRGLLGPRSAARRALGLPAGRYARYRVCDAQLIRRGLPLYQVPAAGQPVPGWMAVGFALFRALGRPLGRYRPPPAPDYAAPVGARAVRHGRVAETYPDAVFCALLGHRPPPKRTPAGRVARVEALAGAGIVAADGGGLWRLGADELDACAAACAAWALARGAGSWVGDPREGVIVLPVAQLRDRYARP